MIYMKKKVTEIVIIGLNLRAGEERDPNSIFTTGSVFIEAGADTGGAGVISTSSFIG